MGAGAVKPVARSSFLESALEGHDPTLDALRRSKAASVVYGRKVRSRFRYGAPDWEVEGWVSSYAAIAEGEFDVVSDAVQDIAGHPPMTLEAYVRSYPASVEHVDG